MKRGKSRFSGKLVGVVAVVAIVAGVVHFSGGSEASQAPTASTALPVAAKTMALEPAQLWSTFSGRLQPVASAEIRPEVSGRITKVLFQDGKAVRAGDTLFVIDPGPYEAAVAKAEADLASAKTSATFAALEQKRAGSMLKSKAIAQRIFDERANANRVAAAEVKAAEAQLKQARIDLDHAYVKAPITGRAGRVEITQGNLVQAGPGAPLLTSIVANDAVYADFEVDEQTYMQTIRNTADKRLEERRIPVELLLQGDKEHSYKGTIYSFDNRLDVASGTIRARARFANNDGALLPGMFVSVKLGGGGAQTLLMVPEKAVGFDQSKKFVYVINAENKAEYREVVLGDKLDANRIVLSGLSEGDRVITDGIMHVRPGTLVEATNAAEPKIVANVTQH